MRYIVKSYVMFVLCLLAMVIGCGKKLPDGMPKLYPVRFQVTQSDKPCAGASVRLIPEGDSPWIVGGTSDANGMVAPQTHGEYPGVPVGKYKVTVMKVDIELGPPSTSMYDSQRSEAFTLVDEKYANPKTTPLQLEVVAGANDIKPFDVGAEMRAKVKKPSM
ncbi:MAG: carboxypeptidase regulatory-like domain-containing protein [Thermoguttaceae bacterium]